MSKWWAWPLIMLMGAVLMACHLDESARADVHEYNLNEPFTLGGGQEAMIAGQNLRVRFAEVLEDSRCPARVNCFWTGQARISVTVSPQGSAPTTLQFNTNPAPGQTVMVGEVGGYRIELKSLDPQPQTPDDPIPFEQYRATFVVQKG